MDPTISPEPKDIFKALSDQTRIRLIRLLTQAEGEVCLCEFVDSLLEPEYKLSRHVKTLRDVGLLASRKEGKWVYHSLVRGEAYVEGLYKLIGDVPDTDQMFFNDLCRFKERMKLREDGRCQVGIQTRELAECDDCGT